MAERVLILSADKWAMPDEKTGEMRNGVSVWYVNQYREDTPDSWGYKPTKIGADPSLLDEIRSAKLPAVFEADYGSRPGAQNKPTLTLTKLVKLGSVNAFHAKAPAAQPA